MKRYIIIILIAAVMLSSAQAGSNFAPQVVLTPERINPVDGDVVAASSGSSYGMTSYVIIEQTDGDIPMTGSVWSSLLNSRGVPTVVLQTSEVVANPAIIHGAPAIIIDGSVGSLDGYLVSESFVSILIQEDTSILLTGRSAWLLHRLSGRDPPSSTAPAETVVYTYPVYAGAVFLNSPSIISPGLSLTNESALLLPRDLTQTAMSRLVNLTSSSSSTKLAPLRFDSWPLDIFLFAPENPILLTPTGQDLFLNIIAYCTAIRESAAASVLSESQSHAESLLQGGMSWAHEPTISGTYYAVHTIETISTGSYWTEWVSNNKDLVQAILNDLLVDYGTECGFMTSRTEGIVDCRSTAQGLWLVSKMGLGTQFPLSEIVNYLSTRQSPDGGFENYITTTYHVTESLWVSGQLASIDAFQLELWLRSLIIDGSKTSDPNLWGAIGSNPTSIAPLNNYAVEYLMSLAFLGKVHSDPSKLTNWILTRTSNGDGSFKNSVGLDEELVTGTASALASLQLLATLSPINKSAGLGWLANNQLPSGGFGLKQAEFDLVGKTRETSRVANCLRTLDESSGAIAQELSNYVYSITTDGGFEIMDPLPSLMWTSWLLQVSRLMHSSQSVNLSLASEYISSFSKFTVYPFWSNLTTAISPEYSPSQYRAKSVWTQYFGITAAETLGLTLNPNVVSDVVLYLSQSEYATGHYRPTPLTLPAHMQYSVAAIETLFILDALGSIPYRASLESAILSEYRSGSWSMEGWTLSPFASSQEAIDYLSTRAALRLGLITPPMASEIAATIAARLQYSDLMALSWDVATLSLLQTAAFSVTLESVDTSLILSALRSSHFTHGWYNSSVLWQPVYTTSVLRMISILGIRCLLFDTPGTNLTADCVSLIHLGDTLDIYVNTTSGVSGHTILVEAFAESLLFKDVENFDVLHFPVPVAESSLGPGNVLLVVMDWGVSRAFESLVVSAEGTIEGSLSVQTPTVKMGEFINGTVLWELATGGETGIAHVTLSLELSSSNYQWSYDVSNPLVFSLPTDDISAGTYNLSVTVEVPYCSPLVFLDEVIIVEPDPTYLLAATEIIGTVNEELDIDWSLHYSDNDSLVVNQEVLLVILDSSETVVYSNIMVSGFGSNSFRWAPNSRGTFTFSLTFDGNKTLDGSRVEGSINIYQLTDLVWLGPEILEQNSTANISVLLETTEGELLDGQAVRVTITAPSSVIVMDSWFNTNGTGYIAIVFYVPQNGMYLLQAHYSGNGFLEGCVSEDFLISWSTSILELGGIQPEATVGRTYPLWAHLEDHFSNSIPFQELLLRITLLPATILIEQTFITNSSGFVYFQWTTGSAGLYRFEALYAGTVSRSSVNASLDYDVLIPVTLDVSNSPFSEVGFQEIIRIDAYDHLNNPLSGISLSITIYGPEYFILYTGTSSTINGIATFVWTPSKRGVNELTVVAIQQGVYMEASSTSTMDVYETPDIQLQIPVGSLAPSNDVINISLTDYNSLPVSGAIIHVEVTLNSFGIVDGDFLLDGNGYLSMGISLSAPGTLHVRASILSQGWLLGNTVNASSIVRATTTLTVIIPGQPVEQGSTVGIQVALVDFSGAPLVGAAVQINVTWGNGTLIKTMIRTTDASGHCIAAQTFNTVGDFIIRGFYAGFGLNSSSAHVVPQRVFVAPDIAVGHDPSCIVGEPLEFRVSLTDALGNFIIGRTIHLSIVQAGSEVFVIDFQTESSSSVIVWYPIQGGLASITMTHLGDIYCLTASNATTVSVMELVTGSLTLFPNEIDINETTTFVYSLQTPLPRPRISIHFEVLGMDLVPIWSIDILTNSSGIALTSYTAAEAYGVLHVNAGPGFGEYLIGGDSQEELIVMTFGHVIVSLQPTPPSANTLMNITIKVTDDFGRSIDGPSISVYLYNPYGEVVKLGTWTNSIIVPIEDGWAFVEFTPTMVGLYTVELSSSGSISVHSFALTTHHTIYSVTEVQLNVLGYELEVGQTVSATVRLLDHNSVPLSGRSIALYLDGPGAISVGPVVLVTNSTGYVSWSPIVGYEGLWILDVTFSGLGVYLPSSDSTTLNVRYGTIIDLLLDTSGDIIAGQTEVNFSILLTDSGGTPLEGFTVKYEVHHTILGLVAQGSIIQTDASPVFLVLILPRMGEYTVIVSFAGTTHYHSSNAGLQLMVLGTTRIVAPVPESSDRSSEDAIPIVIVDEISLPITLAELNIAIEIHGPEGTVDLSSRLIWNTTLVELKTFGFSRGNYTLSIIVLGNELRLGCSELFEFRITSTTRIVLTEEVLPELISMPHSVTFYLLDSLDEPVSAAAIWVSLYDPLEREIYGHPLSTKTLLESSSEGTEVSWIPTLIGEYELLLVFEGDTCLNATSLEISILVLHESTLTVDAPSRTDYGENVPVSVTLSGSLGGISGATVTLSVLMDGEVEQLLSLVTGVRGIVSTDLAGLLAGNHTLIITYAGSSTQASCAFNLTLKISPIVVVDTVKLVTLIVGNNCSIELSVSVIGTSASWNGSLKSTLFDPTGLKIVARHFAIGASSTFQIDFLPLSEGLYTLNVTIVGLPVITELSYQIVLAVVDRNLVMQLGAEATPLLGSVGVLTAIGLVARKKMKGMIESIASEWHE